MCQNSVRKLSDANICQNSIRKDLKYIRNVSDFINVSENCQCFIWKTVWNMSEISLLTQFWHIYYWFRTHFCIWQYSDRILTDIWQISKSFGTYMKEEYQTSLSSVNSLYACIVCSFVIIQLFAQVIGMSNVNRRGAKCVPISPIILTPWPLNQSINTMH